MAEFRVVLACVAASVIGGCATLPEYREDEVNTADIVRNIKCELRDAAWLDPANYWIRDWNAALLLSLIIDHNGAVDADLNWTFPMNQGANFILALTGGITGAANRTERIDFKENLTKLYNDQKLECEREDPGRYARLGGRIGIGDLFARVGLMKELANIDPKELSYNLDFVIKKSATTTPKFNLLPIGKEKTFTGSLKWTGGRTDTHTLKIVLQPPPKEECPVALYNNRCPTLVYQVPVPVAEPEGAPERGPAPRRKSLGPPSPASRQPQPGAIFVQPQQRGLSPSVEERLDAGKGRNVLESIEGQLRRQGLGN